MMLSRRHVLAGSGATLAGPLVLGTSLDQAQPARLTVLFDAFGKPSSLKRGWGYAALIEYGGRRVLFDTGSRGADFAHNVSSLKVNLKRLDFAVISHRHNDHTGGLNHVLQQNPSVPIYTPVEGAGFNSLSPPGLIAMMRRKVENVPQARLAPALDGLRCKRIEELLALEIDRSDECLHDRAGRT